MRQFHGSARYLPERQPAARVDIPHDLFQNALFLFFGAATSALDGSKEQDLVRAVSGFSSPLVIAHRLSTVACCDRAMQVLGHRKI